MFLTKKYLSRRAILRGAGVTLALPFLDAMVPAQTPISKTAANLQRHGWPVSRWSTARQEAR